ncbi:MAG: cytidylate kinase [Gammaproteobacteria bacterium GWF2_41_13]|nr:MAG: cytidylate kinase [Gammaproteobacteria bacterium GWF2_41_13]
MLTLLQNNYNQNVVPVITIDGPSGSGKGTIGQLLANRLQWHFLDSGAIYRIVALAAERHQVPIDDEVNLVRLAETIQIVFQTTQGSIQIFLDQQNVTQAIRQETISQLASKIAAFPRVREALLALQRSFRKAPGLVADGRDMGTVVFPDACLKIYLEASVEERAKRRHQQLLEKGFDVRLMPLIDELIERDRRDKNRKDSPLVPAVDAVLIDTTSLSIEKVMTQVFDLACQRVSSLKK